MLAFDRTPAGGDAVKTSDVPAADILDACRAFHAGRGPTPDVALADRYPPKVVLARMRRLVADGTLECGVSLRTAWVAGDGPGGGS